MYKFDRRKPPDISSTGCMEMLAQEYGKDYQELETSAVRYTRDELGQLLRKLMSFL